MSKLLEIFGKGITVNTAEIVWHWLNQILPPEESCDSDFPKVKILDHLANRELVQAESKIRDRLVDNPNSVWERMAASAACLLQNDIEESLKQTQSVYFRQPSNTMALYVMGYCHERLGHIEQALEFYQDCVKFKSHLQLPRQRMAAIYLQEGRIDKATSEYEQLTSEYPDDIPSLVLLGHLYLASQKISQAIDTFNLAILSHPDNFMEFQEEDEIESLIQCGMFDQALEKIQGTIQQVGAMPELIIRMADVYSAWEKDAEAIACFEQAIRIHPGSLEGTIKLGTHYLKNRRFSLAAEQFNRAADINEEILDAYMGLAVAQKAGGRAKEAMETLSLASAIQQNSILLFSESACLQFQSIMDEKNADKPASDKDIVSVGDVIRVYQEQFKRSGSRPDVSYKYGLLMMGEHNLPMAASLFQNTLELNPIYFRAHQKLVLCAYDEGQPEKAIKMLACTESFGACVYERYYRLSVLYTNKKTFTEAVKRLNRIRSADMADAAETQVNLEIVLENLGLIDRTFTSWERLGESSTCLVKIKERKTACHPHKG
ncbi:MAG: tetratricopeptide repeat protein [Planctomycetales bacterium]|nr:tetratricopeptide repeat protein [Planctomycetales bacterium]